MINEPTQEDVAKQAELEERAQEIGDQDFSGDTTYREWLAGKFMAALLSRKDLPRGKDFAPVASDLHHYIANVLRFLAFNQLMDEKNDDNQEQEDH